MFSEGTLSNLMPKKYLASAISNVPFSPVQTPPVPTAPLVALNLIGTGGIIDEDKTLSTSVPGTKLSLAAFKLEDPSPTTLVLSDKEFVVLTTGRPLNPNGNAVFGISLSSTSGCIMILTKADLFGLLPVIFNLLSDSVSASKL